MNHDRYVDLVNEHVDGSLDEEQRGVLDLHLDGCTECRELLEELRSLRRLARSLPSPEPPEHVWTSISGRIRKQDRARIWTAATPYLALAAALVLGVALWIGLRPPTQEDPAALVGMVTAELRAAETHYGNAIGGLEQIIASNDGVLPSDLESVLNANLDLIEEAIQDSRQAIRSHPESTVAQESLLTALRRKVSLLQSTILLINEIRKGEGENARDLLDEMRKSSEPGDPS